MKVISHKPSTCWQHCLHQEKSIPSSPKTFMSLFLCDSSPLRSPLFIFWSLFLTSMFILYFEVMNAIYYKEDYWIELLGDENVGYDDGWCESLNADLSRYIIEPGNARSGYFFILAGAVMVVLGIRDSMKIHRQIQFHKDSSINQKIEQQREDEERATNSTTINVDYGDSECMLRSDENDNKDINCKKNDKDSSRNQKEEPKGEDEEAAIISTINPDKYGESKTMLRSDEKDNKNIGSKQNEDELVISYENEGFEEMMSEQKILNPLVRYPQLSIGNGIFTILLGLGTFLYHACECKAWFGSKADGAGMMSVIFFPTFYWIPQVSIVDTSIPTANHLRNQCLASIPVFAQAFIWVICMFTDVPATLIFRGIVFFSLFVNVLVFFYFRFYYNKRNKRKHNLKWWMVFIILGFFGLGYSVWYLDRTKIWCTQGLSYLSLFRGHVIWHMLTAISNFCIYLYFRTENIVVE